MFLLLAIILVLAWLGGFTLMHVSSLLIHLLLIFAVISLIMHFIGGRKTA
ncbi:lmo0937 family membrane protein [Terriglobus tenax]|nr:lmo0937 family membrane protein [Terriglobus tenax]